MARLRHEWEADKQRVHEAGDEEAIASVKRGERLAADPDLWENPPSVLGQLNEHLERPAWWEYAWLAGYMLAGVYVFLVILDAI